MLPLVLSASPQLFPIEREEADHPTMHKVTVAYVITHVSL